MCYINTRNHLDVCHFLTKESHIEPVGTVKYVGLPKKNNHTGVSLNKFGRIKVEQ